MSAREQLRISISHSRTVGPGANLRLNFARYEICRNMQQLLKACGVFTRVMSEALLKKILEDNPEIEVERDLQRSVSPLLPPVPLLPQLFGGSFITTTKNVTYFFSQYTQAALFRIK